MHVSLTVLLLVHSVSSILAEHKAPTDKDFLVDFERKVLDSVDDDTEAAYTHPSRRAGLGAQHSTYDADAAGEEVEEAAREQRRQLAERLSAQTQTERQRLSALRQKRMEAQAARLAAIKAKEQQVLMYGAPVPAPAPAAASAAPAVAAPASSAATAPSTVTAASAGTAAPATPAAPVKLKFSLVKPK